MELYVALTQYFMWGQNTPPALYLALSNANICCCMALMQMCQDLFI